MEHWAKMGYETSYENYIFNWYVVLPTSGVYEKGSLTFSGDLEMEY